MNICVFGSASDDIDKRYIEAVENLSEKLANDGHNLVFGAGGCGLMGAAARGFKKGGAKIVGVVPQYFKDHFVETLYEECDELIYTEDMSERKRIMVNKSDAFLITPGGLGTFDELFEILTLKQLHMMEKPIVIYNIDGYYDNIEELLDVAIKKKFINASCKDSYAYLGSDSEILDYINR